MHKEKPYYILIAILSIPFIAWLIFQHVYESVLKLSNKTSDKLFMKRFNFIDDKHFKDYLSWTSRYQMKRALNRNSQDTKKVPSYAENYISSAHIQTKEKP